MCIIHGCVHSNGVCVLYMVVYILMGVCIIHGCVHSNGVCVLYMVVYILMGCVYYTWLCTF